MNIRRGFTLIELLVVIAIIGILSSVVLASLNQARNKAGDAAVKSNMDGVRVQAEIIYDSDLDYDEVCGANSQTQDTTITQAIAAAAAAGGSAVTCGAPASGAASAWSAAAPLKTGGAWCVDSTGVARSKTSGGTDYDGTVAGAGISAPALDSATDTACN